MTKTHSIESEIESVYLKVCEFFGNPAGLARKLEVKPQNLTRWRKKGFPPGIAIEIEILSRGHFKAIDLPLYEYERKKAA